LYLSPVALAVIWGYSLTKRFTALCHLFLGAALALAPLAVWIAITGEIAAPALLLSAGVGTWVAGFDIIYACQDAAFDRENSLRSIPSVLGIGRALFVSGLLHMGTMVALACVPLWLEMGLSYWVGIGLIGVVLVWEHAIVKPSDLSRVNKAFFDLNGYISLVFFTCVWFS
jgi:4-hydroxybenzoate polyprenyltransferase